MSGIEVIIITAGAGLICSILTAVITNYLNRKKDTAVTEDLVASRFAKLSERQNETINELWKRIKDNEEVIRKQQIENEECEYKHRIKDLELTQVKKQINFQSWEQDTVFVLDDNHLVTNEFKWRFKGISTLLCKCFTNSDEFLNEAKAQKPEIVILDYMLEKGKTADQIITELGYEPEIFVMSATKEVAVKFKEKGIRFFYKDDHYVFKIAKSVVEHLNDKN